MRVKGMSAYIRVREMRGQVPGTTCNGARTNDAINSSTTQGMSYIIAPEEVAQYLGTEPKAQGSRSPEVPNTAPVTGATQYRTEEEFMYEILSDVPPNRNPDAATDKYYIAKT